mgnify:CR=1 FL=1
MLDSRIVEISSPAPQCEPLTLTRKLQECPVANATLREWQNEILRSASPECESACSKRDDVELVMRADAWISSQIAAKVLQSARVPAVVRNSDGIALAWLAESTQTPPSEDAVTFTCDERSFLIRYPWDLLRLNEQLLADLPSEDIRGEVSEHAEREGRLILGEGSRILPGVFIEGNVMIGRNCKIGPNCYIRGKTAIGDGCRVGQAVEVKNSLLMDGATLGHLSYCGDSIIGENANFGAGTIVANLRHDGGTHRSLVGEALVDTERRKFGTVVGDEVHTGIHTSIYPGRKIWPHKATEPAQIVQKDIR